MLDKGAQAEVVDLANAALQEHPEIVTLLWDQISHRDGKVPDAVLFSGVMSHKVGIVRMLIEKGANPNVVGTGGLVRRETPLVMAPDSVMQIPCVYSLKGALTQT